MFEVYWKEGIDEEGQSYGYWVYRAGFFEMEVERMPDGSIQAQCSDRESLGIYIPRSFEE